MIPAKYRFHLLWLVPLVIFDVIFFAWWWHRFSSPLHSVSKSPAMGVVAAARGMRIEFACPTDRELDRFNMENFQPTASGRPESAFYGSVRTERIGRRFLPSFHEGIDIAPIERDRAGYPRDVVMSAAAGEVAYVNRYSGNSNYGKYVVLIHGSGSGRVYTLYAHLSAIGTAIRKGVLVEQGTVLGAMGATSTDRIAPANGHLHFEVGLMLNSHFDQWFKRQKLSPDHGNYNGWNLFGVDPLSVYEWQEENGSEYDLPAAFGAMRPAFEIILKTRRPIDFFRRYSVLWHGPEFNGGAVVIACAENGLPLSGRCANGNESAELGIKRHVVGHVDRSLLGRNGCRLVVPHAGQWRLSAEGEKWLNLLLF